MIGGLRQRVTLQRRSDVADTGGGSTLIWSDVAQLWAKVTPLQGGENVQAMRLQPVQEYRVELRHRADVTPAERFLFGARVLNIRSVINVNERGAWLECRCEEGVAG
ncbi:MAG: phage head closure protein [Pseudomonadota bacterium]